MNAIEFLAGNSPADAPTVGIVTLPGEYGQDNAAGAKIAAAELGLEIVFDGEGALGGEDPSGVVSELVAADPDIVYIASSPGILAQVLGGAAAQGLDAIWSGSSLSYNPSLLGTEVAPAIDAFYFHSTYAALWNANDSVGMQDMVATLTERVPQGTYAIADSYVLVGPKRSSPKRFCVKHHQMVTSPAPVLLQQRTKSPSTSRALPQTRLG